MTDVFADFSIRPATAADVATIAAIYADAVRHGTASFETEPPEEDEMACRMATLQEGGYPYLVATAAGRVAGFAYAGRYHSRHGYRHTVEDSVYVAAEARQKGVGRSLLAALIEESKALGFRQMVAVIGDTASAASIRLHESAGFRHVGTMTGIGYKHGRWLDTVFMQCPLGQGSSVPPSR